MLQSLQGLLILLDLLGVCRWVCLLLEAKRDGVLEEVGGEVDLHEGLL
jgi:hypothetical protein